MKKGVAVKAEEILGQLDDRDALTKKKIAELERDAAKEQAESDAQVDAAKKGEEVTRLNYQANEELNKTKQGAISPFDLRRSWFEWQRALAQISVAEVEKRVAQATQLAKEGQIEGAMNEIERLKIVAPIDGFVNEVYKHVGEWCQPGDPIMEIIRMDRVEIEGFVFAADASPAKVLDKPVDVIVQLAGGETYQASGKITFASSVLEGSGRIRQFRVSTEIDNKKNGDHWIIQVGTEAEMVIHLEPPAPKPAVAPKAGLPGGTKSSLPGTKVEAYKPALPDLDGKGAKTQAGGNTDAKSAAKSDEKPKTGDTSTDAAKASKKTKTDAGNSDSRKTEKSDATKASTAKSADDSGKNDKSSEPSDADKPTDKGGKTPSKGTKIKI
ncbi:MAG TPA: HlyD family efflux transporter periplasmic adaptor subunit [Pirellulaceae bacterium]|nr:HlyD family efflux transporter periplasmic adaptor subunit [Pirellulaceae bacterium]